MKKLFRNILIPAAAILTAVTAVSLQPDPGRQAEFSAEKYLPPFEPDSPAKITVSWRDTVTTLTFENGRWLIKEREGHPADPGKIAEFIESVRKIRPLRRAIPDDPETCSLLRVNPEEGSPEKIPGVRVRILDRNGAVLRDLTLGLGYFTDPSNAKNPNAQPDGRWAGLVSKDGKKATPFLISRVFEEYHPLPGGWMTAPVFSGFSGIVRIRFRSEKYGSWMIARLSPEEPFSSVLPTSGKEVPRQNTNALASVLSRRFTFDGVREKDAGTLTEIGSFSAADRTGFLRTLTFYASDKPVGGVLCKVDARCKKDDLDGKKRVEAFLDGRTGWLYVIPDKLFDTIRTNPAGN